MTDRYSILLEAWKRERRSQAVQPLPDSFYSDMSEYASRLREQTRMLDTGSMRARIAEKERENAEKMIKDLFQMRARKIAAAEMDGSPIDPMSLTAEEKRLHAELSRLLSAHSEALRSMLVGRAPQVAAKLAPSGFKVVRFVEALPAIIGIDMKTYGPFRPEDVASIPAENAENLIRRGIAKEVVVSG